VQFQPANPSVSYEPTDSVIVFRGLPDGDYINIGTIRVVGRDRDDLLKDIRDRARKIGAHAVAVKPPAVRTNAYVSERRQEFGKVEYIMEAEALRRKGR
jgi:hypothetical protein